MSPYTVASPRKKSHPNAGIGGRNTQLEKIGVVLESWSWNQKPRGATSLSTLDPMNPQAPELPHKGWKRSNPEDSESSSSATDIDNIDDAKDEEDGDERDNNESQQFGWREACWQHKEHPGFSAEELPTQAQIAHPLTLDFKFQYSHNEDDNTSWIDLNNTNQAPYQEYRWNNWAFRLLPGTSPIIY
ncbi:uncharacterized protein BJ212DRAFT_1303706 [Suillus subaureus]|uniref:Uncharacterized protein n=1 Tax=Suillus subaureus TaxID=48587 RepID=A0A9P7J762_9AGAM|nr:uncharacterized protein BJ212DRAFT_1303706 [Suillus subaureus]KAG1806184.1 hypothetical protein BJ212DRAFT_1303706 [Suillus subaureus]